MLTINVHPRGEVPVSTLQYNILEHLSAGTGYVFWDKMPRYCDLLHSAALLTLRSGRGFETDHLWKADDYTQLVELLYQHYKQRRDLEWPPKEG